MIGSGAAGSCFAAFLRKAGADITLVDPYKEHMDKVAADGLISPSIPTSIITSTDSKQPTQQTISA